MSWTDTVKKILGYFWVNVFRDSWLIDSICRFFESVLGKSIAGRLAQINKQLSVKAIPNSDSFFPVCVVVDASNTSNMVALDQFSIQDNQIGTVQDGYAYKAVGMKLTPVKIQDRVDQPSVELYLGTDYQVQGGQIVFGSSLTDLGFTQEVVTINGQLKVGFKLWCTYDTHSTVLDRFSGILNLPAYWAYKYPGSIETAWSIKINGSNKRDVLKLLAQVGQCQIKSPSNLNHQDADLFISCTQDKQDIPAIYMWKDGVPSSIPQIPVITDVGVLYADNTEKSVTENILPLSGGLYEEYKQMCQQLNANDTVPYAQLPAEINPAQYIMGTVWRHSGFIMVVPSSNYQDMCLAVQFILANTALGSIPIVFRHSKKVRQVFHPSIKYTTKALKYYEDSINNGTQLEVK